MHNHVISASILSADFAHLGDEAKQALDAGADYIHFDVMDYHFVPNLSFGAVICESLRKAGITAPIDVHLMVEHPEKYIKPFANAGATLLTFHPETVNNIEDTLHKIQDAGMKVGLAFNPEKPVDIDLEILQELDLILLMSVNPGFGGQSFIPSTLEKITAARELIKKIKSKAMLGIDGGIKTANIGEVAKAGADFFVVGSGLFHASDYDEEITSMRKQLTS